MSTIKSVAVEKSLDSVRSAWIGISSRNRPWLKKKTGEKTEAPTPRHRQQGRREGGFECSTPSADLGSQPRVLLGVAASGLQA